MLAASFSGAGFLSSVLVEARSLIPAAFRSAVSPSCATARDGLASAPAAQLPFSLPWSTRRPALFASVNVDPKVFPAAFAVAG
jgi:hypothetical protein